MPRAYQLAEAVDRLNRLETSVVNALEELKGTIGRLSEEDSNTGRDRQEGVKFSAIKGGVGGGQIPG